MLSVYVCIHINISIYTNVSAGVTRRLGSLWAQVRPCTRFGLAKGLHWAPVHFGRRFGLALGSALHQVRPCTRFGLAPVSALHQVWPCTRFGLGVRISGLWNLFAPGSALHLVRPWRQNFGALESLHTRFGLGVRISRLSSLFRFVLDVRISGLSRLFVPGSAYASSFGSRLALFTPGSALASDLLDFGSRSSFFAPGYALASNPFADQVHFGRSDLPWPNWSTVDWSSLVDQVPFGRSSLLWPIKSTWLRSTWSSDFVINSGDARLSHRINFTSGLL